MNTVSVIVSVEGSSNDRNQTRRTDATGSICASMDSDSLVVSIAPRHSSADGEKPRSQPKELAFLER